MFLWCDSAQPPLGRDLQVRYRLASSEISNTLLVMVVMQAWQDQSRQVKMYSGKDLHLMIDRRIIYPIFGAVDPIFHMRVVIALNLLKVQVSRNRWNSNWMPVGLEQRGGNSTLNPHPLASFRSTIFVGSAHALPLMVFTVTSENSNYRQSTDSQHNHTRVAIGALESNSDYRG
jgi:hypothetical protein